MESFLFALNAVMPLILLVLLGYILKKVGMISKSFVPMANKLVFYVFLPATLFLNVYKMEGSDGIKIGYIIYGISVTLSIFVTVMLFARILSKHGNRRGVILQASFRSNYSLVGIALASALFKEKGVAAAALMSVIIIPLFNVLAVVSLSIFSSDGKKPKLGNVLRSIAKNPLIISTLAGLLCVFVRGPLTSLGVGFRISDVVLVYRVLEYLSGISTPLALIILGAQFEFSQVGKMKREIILATTIRTAMVPTLGLGLAYICFRDVFLPEHFAALVAMFATPVAVSSVPMAQEMDSDVSLAGQLVVWTTLISAFSLFII